MDSKQSVALDKQKYLFLTLLVYLLVLPLPLELATSRVVGYTFLTLVMITGPWAVAHQRWQRLLAIALAVLTVAPGWFSALGESLVSYRLSAAFGTAFFAYMAMLITRELLFDVTEVKAGTLWAAVNVYVTIGIAFAFLYASVGFFVPDAFGGKFMDHGPRDQLEAFVYFSFVTLSTLGYGDMTPSNTITATLAFVEAIVGQLFIAIMIARLVGLYIAKEM